MTDINTLQLAYRYCKGCINTPVATPPYDIRPMNIDLKLALYDITILIFMYGGVDMI